MSYGIINICLVGSRNISKINIKKLAPHVDVISHAYPPPAPDIHPSTNDGLDAWIAGNAHIKGAYYMPFEREIGLYGNRAALHQSFKHPYEIPDQGYFIGKNNPRDIANRDSWIIFDVNHEPATYNTDPQAILDTGNDAVIDWQIETYLKRAHSDGYTHVFLDNLSLDNSFGPSGRYPYLAGTRHSTGDPDQGGYSYAYDDIYDQIDQASTIHSLTSMGQEHYARYVSMYPARLKAGFTRSNIDMKIMPNYNPGGTGFLGPFSTNVIAFSDMIYYEEGFLYYGCPFDPKTGNGYSTGKVRNPRNTGPGPFATTLKFIQQCRDSRQTDFIMQEMVGKGLLTLSADRLSPTQKIQRDAQVRNAITVYLIAYYSGLYLSIAETASPIDGPGNYGNDYASDLIAKEYAWLAGHNAGGNGVGIGKPKGNNPEMQGDCYLRYYEHGFAAFNANESKKLVVNVATPDGVKGLHPMDATIPYSAGPNGNIGGSAPNWTVPLAPQNGCVCLYG